VAQAEEFLLCKHETMTPSPSPTKIKIKKVIKEIERAVFMLRFLQEK
jgi:hypothetical protein